MDNKTQDMDRLVTSVLDWGQARNLLKKSNAKTQCLKTVSEVGELMGYVLGISDGSPKDHIGDILVTLIILCQQTGLGLRNALTSESGPFILDLSTQDFTLKLGVEVGLLADEVAKGRHEMVLMRAIVCVRTLDRISRKYRTTLEECLRVAYTEISGRKGTMVDGCFIKEGDEPGAPDTPINVSASETESGEKYDSEVSDGFEAKLRFEVETLFSMLMQKNRAYGNAALDPVRAFSSASRTECIRVRLDDKISRLMRGQNAGEDVIGDIQGYIALLRIAEREDEGS